MASELITSLSLFKTMLDMAKGLKDMNDTAVRNVAVIELQERILSAREAQSALMDQVRSLKEQVASMETWEAEKQRYQLTDFGGGTFAYVLEESMNRGEPPHYICAGCYQKRQKSILQNQGGKYAGRQRYECPECKSVFFLGEYRPR